MDACIVFKMKDGKIKFLVASGDWVTLSDDHQEPIGLFGPSEASKILHELKYELDEEQRTWKYFMKDVQPSAKWSGFECAEFPADDSPYSKHNQ